MKSTGAFKRLLILAAVAGLLTACGPSGNESGTLKGTVYSRTSGGKPVVAYDAGNSYAIGADGLVQLRYDGGRVQVEAPQRLRPESGEGTPGSDDPAEYDSGFFLADRLTAIASGGPGKRPVEVRISENQGKDWRTVRLDEEAYGAPEFIGFRTRKEGWLVVCRFMGMGREDHLLYTTEDGGQSWSRVDGNLNEVYPRVATGAGFATKDIGLMGFRYETEFQPALIRTEDGGKTWSKLTVNLPEELKAYSKTPLSPVFDGKTVNLPVQLSRDGADNIVATVYLTSEDSGRTWTYDKSLDQWKK